MRPLALALLVGLAPACHDKHDDHGDDHGEHADPKTELVQLSQKGLEGSGIELGRVVAKPLAGATSVPAEVRLNPDRVAHVTPLVEGQVVEVKARLGDRVEKGAVLATLRSVALGEARAELSRARSAVTQARAELERQQKLREASIGAEKNYLAAKGELDRATSQLAAARSRLRVYGGKASGGARVAIRSPLAGVVIERHATPGEVVDGERPLFVVADVSRVWIVGRLYEQDVASATLGAKARVSLQAYPGKSWDGTISYVAAVLDEKTRTLPIRVELENPSGELRPGLFGRVSLSAADGVPVSAVPESAVVRIEGADHVFVPADGPRSFRAVRLTTGARAHGWVEVRSGLKTGDAVVTKGVFILKSELLRGELSEEHGH